MTILEEGLSTLVIGLGTVFAVLLFLSLSISIIGYFTYKRPLKKAALAKASAPKDEPAAVVPSHAIAPTQTSSDNGAIPGEVIAAITAAVAAFGQQSSQRLVIRSVRRFTNWNAGR